MLPYGLLDQFVWLPLGGGGLLAYGLVLLLLFPLLWKGRVGGWYFENWFRI